MQYVHPTIVLIMEACLPERLDQCQMYLGAGAHNSHLGDARATDMGRRRGELNLGQLCRERFGSPDPRKVFSIGFSTHTGTVAAARGWGLPVQRMDVLPSMRGAPRHLQEIEAASTPDV